MKINTKEKRYPKKGEHKVDNGVSRGGEIFFFWGGAGDGFHFSWNYRCIPAIFFFFLKLITYLRALAAYLPKFSLVRLRLWIPSITYLQEQKIRIHYGPRAKLVFISEQRAHYQV